MLKSAVSIILTLPLLFGFNGDIIPKGLWKKIDKSISKIWDVAEITKVEINLSEFEPNSDLKLSGNESIYILQNSEGKINGYLAIGSAPSRDDVFELMVIYDTYFNVIMTEILTYREDYGGEIMSTRWLKQFIGKNITDPISLNSDIQGISGATISCRSATFEIRRLTLILDQLKIQNLLTN